MDDKQNTTTIQVSDPQVGIQGLPVFIEPTGYGNDTTSILIANLVAAFERIEALERQVKALTAADADAPDES